ncbi:chorismate-binding protein [Solwaraspora sp. WMMD406]|uniref:chorismate-binding protein n=1 Tax=Solwaraspora sp. WMMD406 TaxID=3016095 RepID=UPI00241648F6|nr:chorismate-binding protein [Solwaraspora sp. WMMD406]MDG4765753.1 chorismate-binding protein [Solwaraspora sp. WMMD406]
MRVLLIDNYDSYTYNLFQLIAAVAGQEPIVLANDDPRLSAVDRLDVWCVVVSPGPGRPQHVTDLGWGWELLETHPDLPVLGVCLGHQAIAFHAGATVRERLPRHGQVDEVRHDGDELFAGVPERFAAVRYHSLQVTAPLPESLRATAWAGDGTVMALRHRRLPRWGVQFHPESIGTTYGAVLIGNFLRLARAHQLHRPCHGAGDPTVPELVRHQIPEPAAPVERPEPPAPVERPEPPAPVDRPAPSLVRDVAVIDAEIDTEAAFAALYAEQPYAFWLDSSLVAAGRSRFSFLGDASGPLSEVLTYRVGAGAVDVVRAGRPVRSEPGGIFDVLDRRLARHRLPDDDLPFDFAGGYVGYFGYEAKADCGATTTHRAATPDAVWIFADRLVVVDHQEGRTYLVAVSDGPVERVAAGHWIAATTERLRGLVADRPASMSTRAPGPVFDQVDRDGGRPDVRQWVRLSRTRPEYLVDVECALVELRRGESYEICLTNRLHLPRVDDPLAYYRLLRRGNPAPHGAYLRLGAVSVASCSPERFLRVERDGQVRSSPMKGTAARDADPRRDDELRRSLTTSAKTRAENMMIVDLLRNDLGRVCEIGSIEVPRFMVTESYATVHQLVSTVGGRLRPDVSAVACARVCFPGGSMTGAPKLRTMEIIDRLEHEARGVYSGALGYFGLGGGADLSIVIRTAVTTEHGTTIGTGGAIVLDSDPAEEYAETMLKARALLTAYGVATRSAR